MIGVRGAAARTFGALVRARERAYQTGRLGVARLPAAVVSVGNLSVGGSGKTPAVIALGRALHRRGIAFDVLTRGYRRHGRDLAFALRGDEDVRQMGDEPLLIARSLQVPVAICRDRFRAGLESERRFASRLHVLDDGFQHRQLARQFDLVLLSVSDLRDQLLPAGRLREPLSALARASALLWVASDSDPDPVALQSKFARLTAAPLFWARRRPLPLNDELDSCFAFCGIARPESFWATLDQLAAPVAGRRAFRDHHFYAARDLRRLEAEARSVGARVFVTTAKDAVKLPPSFGPLRVVEMEMEIAGLDDLVAGMLRACSL